MHEMSYVIKLTSQAESAALSRKALSVENVSIRLGKMTGLLPYYMKKYYRQAVEGSILEGSELIIEEVPVRASCDHCRTIYEPSPDNGYACPCCRSPRGEIISGREFELDHMTIIT